MSIYCLYVRLSVFPSVRLYGCGKSIFNFVFSLTTMMLIHVSFLLLLLFQTTEANSNRQFEWTLNWWTWMWSWNGRGEGKTIAWTFNDRQNGGQAIHLFVAHMPLLAMNLVWFDCNYVATSWQILLPSFGSLLHFFVLSLSLLCSVQFQ